MKKFYITTAIDYVNANLHIGHTLEKVQADALARYRRMLGEDVFFAIGTDEHGDKIQRSAKAAGKETQDFVDEHAEAVKKVYEGLNISNDAFVRTSDSKNHWPSVIEMWKRLEANGDLYKKKYSGLYCVGHEAFVTDKDLNDEGICEMHGKKPELVEEENYFFKLSKYSDQIKEKITSEEFNIIPKKRENEIVSLIDQGLEDVSFSRSKDKLQWGIPVPGDESQVMYVWADALTNYISVLGWAQEKDEKFKKYWPADVHVIGKDILRFHAAIWPAMLISAGIELPKALFVHDFITINGMKISKSLGNVIDPLKLVDEYGADAVRWYLLAEIPPTKDGDFSEEKFVARYNGDLASGMGNLLARVVVMGEKNTSEPLKSSLVPEAEKELKIRLKAYKELMDKYAFNEAIKEAQALMAFTDKRINDTRLWELPDKDEEQFKKEMASAATIVAYIAWMLTPIIPESAQEAANQLGIKLENKDKWEFNFKKGDALFPRL
ncbi:MAG: methionine--tRNA ligase [Candidatus Spechtbacterales bacterium]|nr:methionine--tRNA ligase [Candidatus Spechtbacterales bacterium]